MKLREDRLTQNTLSRLEAVDFEPGEEETGKRGEDERSNEPLPFSCSLRLPAKKEPAW
jgi:hypothetical protein